jgi:fructose-1,6-bisphosphatase I/sedoheptulose-1,7-bisphosphatase
MPEDHDGTAAAVPTAGPDHPTGPALRTLTRFIIEQEHRHGELHPSGEFSGLLNAVSTAVKIIANQVNKGALVDALGSAESTNSGGDEQKRLDLICNEVMISQTEWSGYLAAMASEEMAGVYQIPAAYRRGRYLLIFDPLDGSSNIDVNISVGTIFSILRAPSTSSQPTEADFLQAGTEQVCAGFALYGPSTMLVLSTGDGVDAFTLDRDIGAFMLTHPQMRIPETTSEFAINASNERFWEAPVRRYVKECLEGRSGPRERDFNMRWIASLVAEAYRILVRGGVFLYPADSRRGSGQGRLRLLYEANPIGFVVEQAGGRASTGREPVLTVTPSGLHQRCPLIFGSAEEVERIERYHREDEGAGFDGSLFNVRSLLRH